MTTIALIAHDEKKKDMVIFVNKNAQKLADMNIVATGTTGGLILRTLPDLYLEKVASGPMGGDAQIAAKIVEKKIDAVIFFIDPLSSHPHDPDINGLLRICMVYDIPLALNESSSQILIDHLKK